MFSARVSSSEVSKKEKVKVHLWVETKANSTIGHINVWQGSKIDVVGADVKVVAESQKALKASADAQNEKFDVTCAAVLEIQANLKKLLKSQNVEAVCSGDFTIIYKVII